MPTILQRVADGDRSAVDACVAEYGGLIWRLANRYLDRARGEVDDAVQEVFVELWLKASSYDESVGSEAAFVATVAHRRLIDYQRRVQSRRATLARAEALKIPQLSGVTMPTNSSIDPELAAEFDKLPDQERQPLWLAIHSGMTHRQIAETLETPVGTVKTRIRRGVARLYGVLAPSRGLSKEGVSA